MQPPTPKRVITCLHKRRYADEFAARAGAMTAIEHSNKIDKLWVYSCPECKGWHLTSTRKSRRSLVTRDNPVHERGID